MREASRSPENYVPVIGRWVTRASVALLDVQTHNPDLGRPRGVPEEASRADNSAAHVHGSRFIGCDTSPVAGAGLPQRKARFRIAILSGLPPLGCGSDSPITKPVKDRSWSVWRMAQYDSIAFSFAYLASHGR